MKAKVCVAMGVLAMVLPVALAQNAGQSSDDQRHSTQGQSGSTAGQSGSSAGQSGSSAGQSSGASGQSGQSARSGQSGQGQQAGGQQNIDQNFLKNAIQCSLFEQQVAKVVAQKVDNEQVKQFAQRIQEDHQQTGQQLKQIAQGKQMQVPNQMEQWQQALIQHLQQLDPQSLQNEFLFGTVAGHQKSILMHKLAAQKAQDAEIKTLAARHLPTLQQHLQQATRLTEQVTGVSAEPMGVTGR